MGETMKNKIIIAGALFLLLGMTGAAQQSQQQSQQQFQQGEIFQNEDTRLNAVYAVDGQGDFYGMIFGDDQANFFGTVDSFNALEGDNVRVCQHYLVRSGGLLNNIFGNKRTASQVTCVPLQGNVSAGQEQLPVQPQHEFNQSQDQTNQTQQNQTNQSEQQNQSQQSDQMSSPNIFYA